MILWGYGTVDGKDGVIGGDVSRRTPAVWKEGFLLWLISTKIYVCGVGVGIMGDF